MELNFMKLKRIITVMIENFDQCTFKINLRFDFKISYEFIR